MKSHQSFLLILLVCLLSCGCTPARHFGGVVGRAALAAPLFVAEGFVNGLFNNDETLGEQIDREEHDESWKEYWRANPNTNSRMAAEYTEKKNFMANHNQESITQ